MSCFIENNGKILCGTVMLMYAATIFERRKFRWIFACQVQLFLKTISVGVLTVAVTNQAPSDPYDSQLWIRRYIDIFASSLNLKLSLVEVPFDKSWELAGQNVVDLVATNIASFKDRIHTGGTFSAPFLRERRALRIKAAVKDRFTRLSDFDGKTVGAVRGMAAERDLLRRAQESMTVVSTQNFLELYQKFDSGELDAIAQAEYYTLDGKVISSHGPELVSIDQHDLNPGQPEESVFVVRNASTHLLAALDRFIADNHFPICF